MAALMTSEIPLNPDLPAPGAAPVVDVVVPVFDEARVLADTVARLHRYLTEHFPFAWRITIVDNASTDATAEIATRLAGTFERVRFIGLDRKGRGLALRTAWTDSDAAVVAYMDVDLSTDLDALLPLVAPLVSGHSDIAIGNRLLPTSNVARGPKREAISRVYNVMLRAAFSARFSDAQCGFKAVRTEVARRIVPLIEDDAWFFDTELLLLAEHNGLRIHQVPVDWVDDPDSRVDVTSTAVEDLRGMVRMARTFAAGGGVMARHDDDRRHLDDDFGRRLVLFAGVGLASTAISVGVYLALRTIAGPYLAVVCALFTTAVGNAWAHRRWTLGRRSAMARSHALATASVTAGSVVLSLVALAATRSAGGGLAAELVALGVAWALVAAVRFALLSRWTTTSQMETTR